MAIRRWQGDGWTDLKRTQELQERPVVLPPVKLLAIPGYGSAKVEWNPVSLRISFGSTCLFGHNLLRHHRHRLLRIH